MIVTVRGLREAGVVVIEFDRGGVKYVPVLTTDEAQSIGKQLILAARETEEARYEKHVNHGKNGEE